MTPTTSITPLPDFATIFHQIVGETIFGLNDFTPEERFSLGLEQAEKTEQLLLEVIQTRQSCNEQRPCSQPWESLKHKLSRSN